MVGCGAPERTTIEKRARAASKSPPIRRSLMRTTLNLLSNAQAYPFDKSQFVERTLFQAVVQDLGDIEPMQRWILRDGSNQDGSHKRNVALELSLTSRLRLRGAHILFRFLLKFKIPEKWPYWIRTYCVSQTDRQNLRERSGGIGHLQQVTRTTSEGNRTLLTVALQLASAPPTLG